MIIEYTKYKNTRKNNYLYSSFFLLLFCCYLLGMFSILMIFELYCDFVEEIQFQIIVLILLKYSEAIGRVDRTMNHDALCNKYCFMLFLNFDRKKKKEKYCCKIFYITKEVTNYFQFELNFEDRNHH